MTGLFDRDEALGSGPEMPVMPNAAILAAGAHDQACERAAHRTLRLDASGRGKAKPGSSSPRADRSDQILAQIVKLVLTGEALS